MPPPTQMGMTTRTPTTHGHSHDHGHSHAHETGPLSWRGLFALGLSGGLMPSAAALILLLGSIAAGRVAYGLLLVVGFGVGMALVLGGVGLSLVYAARLVERLPVRNQFARRSGMLQMAHRVPGHRARRRADRSGPDTGPVTNQARIYWPVAAPSRACWSASRTSPVQPGP